jgi:hypothetical protein
MDSAQLSIFKSQNERMTSPYSSISKKEVKAFKKGFADHKNDLPRNPSKNFSSQENFAYDNGWCKFGLIATSLDELSDEKIREIIYDPSGCGKC